MINVADYWPVPGLGHSITKVFDNGFREMIVPARGGGAWLEEWTHDIWQDTWHYYIDPSRGVLEDYDYTPDSNPVMIPGKEIIWGKSVNIGDTIQGQCAIKGVLGFGVQYGWQRVYFKSLIASCLTAAGTFKDVLVLDYNQYWTAYGAPGGMTGKGATIWLAKGLGFIRLIWEKDGVAVPGATVGVQSITVI